MSIINIDSLSKVIKHLKKKVNIFELVRKIIQIIRSERDKRLPLEVKGSNWLSDTELPVAIFIGFNPWKRDVFSGFLSEYRCAFTRGVLNWKNIEKEFLLELGLNEVTLVTWGAKPLPRSIYEWQKRNKNKIIIKHLRVEDGFLRSIGKGQLHTRPGSLCVDSSSIYFDAHESSDIEKLALSYDFAKDPMLIKRAKICLDIYNSAYLTKYYDVTLDSKFETFNRTENYSILVVGQVEDDASILNGRSKITKNTDLVKKVVKENPDADIYFKPHPDYLAGNRKAKSNINKLAKVCVILPSDINLNEVIRKVDHIYTITSLVGFEALLKGKKVTTFGAPFYSNWGLTDDRVKLNRRKNKELSLNELFATTMLLYPSYFHMESDEKISFEEQCSFFVLEIIKYHDIYKLEENVIYKNLTCNVEYLSTPFKLLSYLVSTKLPSEGDTNSIIEIIFSNSNFNLRDFSQISFLLIRSSNYDALIEYTNRVLSYVSDNSKNLNLKLVESFFYALKIVLKNTNGRVIGGVPDFYDFFKYRVSNEKYYLTALKYYIECCSFNIQYEYLSRAIDLLNSFTKEQDITVFKLHQSISDKIENELKVVIKTQYVNSIVQVLKQKPSRSERNYNMRYRLTNKCASIYRNLLDSTSKDLLTNSLKYNISIDNHSAILDILNDIPTTYGKEFIEKEIVGSRYMNDWIFISYYLIKSNIKPKKIDFVRKLLDVALAKETPLKFANLHLVYLKSKNAPELDYYINKYIHLFEGNITIQTLYARHLRETGKLSESLIQYRLLHKEAGTVLRKNSLQAEIDKLLFCIESSYILNSVPQPRLPKGVIFIASQTCYNSLAIMIPSLVELKKMGYAIINLTEGMLDISVTGIPAIDKFNSAIPLNLIRSSNIKDIKNTWTIDWNNKKILSSDINFYQGFYEGLSCFARKYHIDINEGHVYNQFKNQLIRSDLILSLCLNIFEDLVIDQNMNVSFITANSHVTPFTIFRDFARAKDHSRLGFINCSVAYESYFSNLGSKFSSSMCVTDMTLHPKLRAPFLARKDQFEPWYEKNKNNVKYKEQADRLIKVNRVGSLTNDKELEVIELIKRKKAEGCKIICAFGKIPVDLAVPFDGGAAHESMADWINHTVEVCSESTEILLLVKPHPHELKPQIALDLIGGFNELVEITSGDNVLFLGHRDINGHALAPYLDLALLYNGSSALELAAQGIPVMMSAYFGRYDYPVDLLYPTSRQQYRDFLLSLKYPIPSLEVREKSAYLMSYLGTSEISIKNDYALRQLTNDKIGSPKWRTKRINEFLSSGDPEMKLIAERIVEKFENKNSNQ